MRIETTRQTCPTPSDVLTAGRFRVAGFAILLGLFSTAALAQSRTFYGADGKVLGRSITDSDGAITYYDAAGRITGRTSGDTMTIYGPDGRVLGTIKTASPVSK